jgi:hypothetical protein
MTADLNREKKKKQTWQRSLPLTPKTPEPGPMESVAAGI